MRFLIPALLLLCGLPARAVSVYAVGNSLTRDATASLDAALGDAADDVDLGYHIQWSSTLILTIREPAPSIDTLGHGAWNEALTTQQYDKLILQPYNRPEFTYEQELAAFKALASLQPNAELWYYETWPIEENFAALWYGEVDEPDEPWIHSRAGHERFVNDLRSAGYDINVIPAGTAWALADGDASLYHDGLHASHDDGRALASALFAWAIADIDPLDRDDLDEDLALLAARAISSSVATGLPGDFNANAQVEQGDLDLMLNNWGAARPFEDGATTFVTTNVDQEELDAVLNHWGSTVAPDFTGSVVPEPMGVAGLSLIGLARLASRSRGQRTR